MYQNDFNSAFKDVRKAVTCLVVIMGTYSVIELLWLKLNLPFAREFLETINPYFYDIAKFNSCHPPLLWESGLRSITMEPSFLGFISIMSLPIVWSYIFKNKFEITCFLLVFYFTLMIAATNSRTAIVIVLGEIFLLISSLILVRKKEYFKLVIVIILITFCSFFASLVYFEGYEIKLKNVKDYFSYNVASVVNTTSRSNGARFANLVAHVNTIVQYPIMGVGTGLQDAYIDRNLPEFSYSNYEVRNWSRFMHIKGVLVSGFSPINLYANIAIQNGLIGLLLYLSVPLYLMYRIFKDRMKLIKDYRNIMLVIAMAGLLVAGLSGSAFVILNGIVWGLLFCKLEEIKKISN